MNQIEKTKHRRIPQSSSWTPECYKGLPETEFEYSRKTSIPTKGTRRQVTTNCYVPNACRAKYHACSSSYGKYAHVYNTEYPHNCSSEKSSKSRQSSNLATVKKHYCKEDPYDEENLKYIDDELGNLTEDNLDEDGLDEVEDDQEDNEDYYDKDLEEADIDDELVEPEVQASKLHKQRKEAYLRDEQRMRALEEDHARRKAQLARMMLCNPSDGKSCYQKGNNDDEGLSEEEVQVPRRTLRVSTKDLPPMPRHGNVHPRSAIERYVSPTKPNRRSQYKPEVECRREPETIKFLNEMKCSRCGNNSADKKSSSDRNSCRLQNHRNYSMKGSIGDNNKADIEKSCERYLSAGHSKGRRRSREARTETYESPDVGPLQGQEFPDEYLDPAFSKELAKASRNRQRTKLSMQSIERNTSGMSRH